jgi:hypothetical protein
MHRPHAAAFDAALHCPSCTEAALKTPIASLSADHHDREGNPITILYSWDVASTDHCDDCREPLI